MNSAEHVHGDPVKGSGPCEGGQMAPDGTKRSAQAVKESQGEGKGVPGKAESVQRRDL